MPAREVKTINAISAVDQTRRTVTLEQTTMKPIVIFQNSNNAIEEQLTHVDSPPISEPLRVYHDQAPASIFLESHTVTGHGNALFAALLRAQPRLSNHAARLRMGRGVSREIARTYEVGLRRQLREHNFIEGLSLRWVASIQSS